MKIDDMDDIDTEGQDDGRIVLVYDIISKLLPIEGRDYEMHPSINDRGGVSFAPVVKTEIGKIWVDYLANMLPRVASIPPNMRDDFISGQFCIPVRDPSTGNMTIGGTRVEDSKEVEIFNFEPGKPRYFVPDTSNTQNK